MPWKYGHINAGRLFDGADAADCSAAVLFIRQRHSQRLRPTMTYCASQTAHNAGVRS